VTGWDGARIPVLCIEPDVARVIQIHPANIEQTRAGTKYPKARPVLPVAQQPGREAIRPDGGDI